MRLRLRLPEVRPEEYAVPLSCPYGCGGHYFALHQQCAKVIGDPNHHEVRVRRYKCVRCGRSFRVHPTGVSGHHRSQRLRGIGVMLYVLGLSYGGVAGWRMPWRPLAGQGARALSTGTYKRRGRPWPACGNCNHSGR
jgi:hypothetical protein